MADSKTVLTAAPAYKCPAAPYEGAMLIGKVWFEKWWLYRTAVNASWSGDDEAD